MRTHRAPILATVVLGASLLLAWPTHAAEIKVLTAGAMKAVVLALTPDFEKQSGHRVVVANDTVGGLVRRIEGGEAFDVGILTPAAIDKLAAAGRVVAASKRELASVGVGVAVREGAPKPDISTVEAFKHLLLRAKAIAYIDPAAGGSSGIYFNDLIGKLGIADEVRAKAKLMRGGYVAELVAKGEADIAVHQISEIVPVKGVVLAGPLPKPIQNITTYAGALGTAATASDAAGALLAHLAGPAANAVLMAKGMEKPAK